MNTNEKKGPYQTFITKLKTGFELTSLEPVKIANWTIQASVSNRDSVVIVMTHINGLTRIGMYNQEDDANKFVTYWLESL